MTTPVGGGASTLQAVQVWSVAKQGTDVVRLLGPVRGMLTHYVPKKPTMCYGAGVCPRERHKRSPDWLGYCASERFDQSRHVWIPCVLEVTKTLEETLRGRELRGEVWGFWREARGDKRSSVMGTFLERFDLAAVRPCFPIEPVLCHLYNEPKLIIDLPNPMPPRLMLAEAGGPSPASLADVIRSVEAQPQEVDPEERKRVLERLRSAWGVRPKGGTAPSANGAGSKRGGS